jgi:hypothetical protein
MDGPRLIALTRDLLNASTLCAIATVSADSRAHINTAYFAWSDRLEIIWLSDPGAEHSRNLARNGSAALSVYDSHQTWGRSDRGMQLFGTARALPAQSADAEHAGEVYASRFDGFSPPSFAGYRLYLFRPTGVKLFDEQALGAGVFVMASVDRDGQMQWLHTEVVSTS